MEHKIFLPLVLPRIFYPSSSLLTRTQTELVEVQAGLKIKQATLKGVEDKLAQLGKQLRAAEKKKAELTAEVEECARKLARATQLISGTVYIPIGHRERESPKPRTVANHSLSP